MTSPNPTPARIGALLAGNSVEINLDGVTGFTQEIDTATALDALAAERLKDFVPALLPDVMYEHVAHDLMQRGTGMSLAFMRYMGCALISELTHMPWWAAIRLAHLSHRMWMELDGQLLLQGVDVLALPLPRALSVLYTALAPQEEEKRAAFDLAVWERPASADDIERGAPSQVADAANKPKPPRWTPEQQYASFNAFVAMGSRYGGGG